MINNTDFWKDIKEIIQEDFNSEGLEKLDYYANLYISGKWIFKRFSPQEQHGCAAGGSSHVVATILAGAETRTDQEDANLSEFKRELKRAAQQASRIEQWARRVGVWIENLIKSPKGNIFVIDCDIRINTPELRLDGVREYTTEIISTM